jgi:hypothetical protein
MALLVGAAIGSAIAVHRKGARGSRVILVCAWIAGVLFITWLPVILFGALF